MSRTLIVNADDFGASEGINRGIADCHAGGVVTSTSLMVHGAAAAEAAALARELPALAVGLHWDLDGEGAPRVDFGDADAVRAELDRQLAAFHDLMGRAPTHLDSHHHVHRRDDLPHLRRVFADVAAPVGVPLRDTGDVHFVGGFYGQWEWEVTDLHHVSPEFLIWMLSNDLVDGWTEISCHPGYVTPGFRSVYLSEREAEVATLTDPRVRAEIERLGIRLASYADFAAEHRRG